tara:strand:- start:1032 stop:1394 length:363 start_codon:yes stop_codon:yes gene_type:complete
MGYDYEWNLKVVASTLTRSRSILKKALVATKLSDTNIEEIHEFEDGSMRANFGRWRSKEDALMKAISKQLVEGEVAYGQWRGEDDDVGWLFATKDNVEDLTGKHPRQKEIDSAYEMRKKN